MMEYTERITPNTTEHTAHLLRSNLQYAHYLKGKKLLDEYIRAGLSLEEAAGLIYHSGINDGVADVKPLYENAIRRRVAKEKRRFEKKLAALTAQVPRKPMTLREAIEEVIAAQFAQNAAQEACTSPQETEPQETEAQPHA